MQAKTIAALVVVALIAIGGGLYVVTGRESDTTESTTQNSTTSTQPSTTANEKSTNSSAEAQTETTSPQEATPTLTAASVAEHASADDCWTIIDGGVYDITDYISRHPGGDNILSACGVDATAFFMGDKAGAEGDTKDHTNERQANNQLASMKLGDLVE